MALGMEVGLGPGHIMLDGDPAPLPHFSAHFYSGQTTGCIRIQLGMEVGLSPGDFVLDGDPAPSSKGGIPPQFSAHVYCGQTAGCIKMRLGMEVGLSPGYFVSDGDPDPLPQKGAEPPIFGPCLLWPNDCMDQDANWCGGRPRPRHDIVLDGDPAPPQKRGRAPLPNFRPISIVDKRLDASRWMHAGMLDALTVCILHDAASCRLTNKHT